jgi:hypothetical protein
MTSLRWRGDRLARIAQAEQMVAAIAELGGGPLMRGDVTIE